MPGTPSEPDELDWMLSSLEDVATPQRGDLLTGYVLSIDAQGMIVDVGLKRDGLIPRADLDRLPERETEFKTGDEVAVMVVDPVDSDGNLIVSLSQARESGDWLGAKRLMDEGEILEAQPSGFNRGGLVVPFGNLRGFVPASHLVDLSRGLSETERLEQLERMVGKEMVFRVIEVDPQRRRLVLSERKAIRQWRQQQKARVLQTLEEGEVRAGTVSSLHDFGAFIDIGGADGLIHISELAWHRIDHPSQVLSVGQEVEALVIRVDRQANRIGLSLKRLQPNPWAAAQENLQAGQVIEGKVTHTGREAVYVDVGEGLEGQLHWPLGDSPLSQGDFVQVRVATMDPSHERIELELVELEMPAIPVTGDEEEEIEPDEGEEGEE